MGLQFDDEATEEAPAPAAQQPTAETPAGQQLYDVLAQVVSEQEEATLLALVEALRSRKPWGRLSRTLRAVLAELDDRLFDAEGE